MFPLKLLILERPQPARRLLDVFSARKSHSFAAIMDFVVERYSIFRLLPVPLDHEIQDGGNDKLCEISALKKTSNRLRAG